MYLYFFPIASYNETFDRIHTDTPHFHPDVIKEFLELISRSKLENSLIIK